MRRPRLAFPPPTQSTHRRILLLPRRHHHPAFRGALGSTSNSDCHRIPMMRIRLRSSPPRAALRRRHRHRVHTAITGAVHQGRQGHRRAPMVLPDRRVAVEQRYTLQPKPHHPGRLIHVAPRTHTRRDPRRVRRRRG